MRTADIPFVRELMKKLPKDRRKEVLSALSKVRKEVDDHNLLNPHVQEIHQAFVWHNTPQGGEYWMEIYRLAHPDGD